MAVAEQEYLVAAFLESHEVGEKFVQWPLHLTLVPWFTIPNLHKARAVVKKTAIEHNSMELYAGGTDRFGSKRRTPVRLIEPTPELQALHDTLHYRLHGRNAVFVSERYIGEDFKPHVSRHAGQGMPAGSSLLLDTIYMVEAEKGADRQMRTKEIIGAYALGARDV